MYEKLQHAKRFDPLPNDLECQLTAAFHPRFRLMWLQKQDPDRVSVVKEAMELQVEACMKEEDEVAAATHRHLQPGQGHPEGKEGLSGR